MMSVNETVTNKDLIAWHHNKKFSHFFNQGRGIATTYQTNRFNKEPNGNQIIDRYSRNIVRGRGFGSNGIKARHFHQGIYMKS